MYIGGIFRLNIVELGSPKDGQNNTKRQVHRLDIEKSQQSVRSIRFCLKRRKPVYPILYGNTLLNWVLSYSCRCKVIYVRGHDPCGRAGGELPEHCEEMVNQFVEVKYRWLRLFSLFEGNCHCSWKLSQRRIEKNGCLLVVVVEGRSGTGIIGHKYPPVPNPYF